MLQPLLTLSAERSDLKKVNATWSIDHMRLAIVKLTHNMVRSISDTMLVWINLDTTSQKRKATHLRVCRLQKRYNIF
jgi:hypothetical protein